MGNNTNSVLLTTLNHSIIEVFKAQGGLGTFTILNLLSILKFSLTLMMIGYCPSSPTLVVQEGKMSFNMNLTCPVNITGSIFCLRNGEVDIPSLPTGCKEIFFQIQRLPAQALPPMIVQ